MGSTAAVPEPTTPHQQTSLAHVADLTEQLRRLYHQRQVAIHQALAASATWAQLGLALGVSAQAAHKRYRWLHHSPLTGETWHEPPLPY
jgi:hypothetical protein